jgi:urease accessory protein
VSADLASLDLAFRQAGARTVLTRRHHGPLRVQKALYPEGEALCHAVLLHPPGGIAGGDELQIDVHVARAAQALITTPGAAKWYKADGRRAAQRVRLHVEGGLEWLPQEAIVFNEAEVESQIDIELGDQAAMLGWDLVALGRAAAGERFTTGAFAQTIRLRQAGRLQWLERTRLGGGDPLLDSPIGLAGQPVFGCLWAAGAPIDQALLETLRQDPAGPMLTQLAPRLWVARACGPQVPAVRDKLQRLWAALRPAVFEGRAAQPPRLWAT